VPCNNIIGRSISYWTHTPCGVHMRGQYEWIRYILLVLPENLLILTIFLLLFVRKSGEGIKELICAYLNSFGQNNRLRYGNNSYSWFTLSEYLWNDGICPWSIRLECYYWKEMQAYKTYKRTRMYARTVFIQDLGFFKWTVNVWIIMVWI
jgi:hypothetical protein